MSFAKTMAALEEFTEEMNSQIDNKQPDQDEDFDGQTAGVDFQEEAGDIDNDVEKISQAVQGLEDIISLVEEAPGEVDQPLEPFVEKAVNVALESNDMVAAAGNPVATVKTKEGKLDKLKAFAARVWEMLRNFGKRIAQWIRETWAKFTDRIVKNANQARKVIEQCKTLATRDGAKIEDKSLLAKIATFKGGEIGDALINVSEHTNDQGGKAAEALTKAASDCIGVVATGNSSTDGVMDRFLDTLAKAAGAYSDEATPEQAQSIKAAGGSKTLVSGPFFAGYRAWVTMPENAEALQYWNHGITKVDNVRPAESMPAPDAQEIKAIAEYIVSLGQLVKVYQNNIKTLDKLNSELDKAASKAKSASDSKAAGEDSKQLKQMQLVVPRIIKGPQVSAYAYATSASTACLQFCMAAIAAHQKDPNAKSVIDKAKDTFSRGEKDKA